MNRRYKHWILSAMLFSAAVNGFAQANASPSIKKMLVGGTWRISKVLAHGSPVYSPGADRLYMVFTKDSIKTLAENQMDQITFPYWIKGKTFYGKLDGRIIAATKILRITPGELRLQKDNNGLIYIFRRT